MVRAYIPLAKTAARDYLIDVGEITSMIEIYCQCAKRRHAPESAVGTRIECPACHQASILVAAEQIPAGAGSADFDANLTVVEGPVLAGTQFLLGGVADIGIGKMSDRNIVLPGREISRQHCRLVRLDFGPSRWKIVDNRSTNGVVVNGQRVEEVELQPGDEVRLGEYVLRYGRSEWEAAPASGASANANTAGAAAYAATEGATKAGAAGGPVCPSCDKQLPAKAKICVECGIHIDSGRPLLTSRGLDEDSLFHNAYQLIRVVSLLVWVTPMPIPIRSEAYGARKPYAIWTIAILTTLASLVFFIVQNSGGAGFNRPGSQFMLWSPWASGGGDLVKDIGSSRIHDIAQSLTDKDRQKLRDEVDPGGKMSDDDLVAAAIQAVLSSPQGRFHWYQLITHAFLHDTGSVYGFIMHLGGNMLFLLVFGTRVNALIGDIATAIAYPILAVCAAMAHLLAGGASMHGPMLGASGAIMGLAGLYLLLFPVHRILCAMWISIWFWFRRYFGCKIFWVRGFWVLLIYFGYDLLMNLLSWSFGLGGGGVAHWAHVGGFVTGMLVGLLILMSRQFQTNGGDLLSVMLGRKAWRLVGKPSQWNTAQQTALLPPALR